MHPLISKPTLSRLAVITSEVLAPAILVTATLLAVAHVTDSRWLLTTPIAVVFLAVIPQTTAHLMVAGGRATDKFIRRREQRHLFYGAALGSTVVGAVLVSLVTASTHVRWAVYIATAVIVVVSVINLRFKISMHALVAALAAVVIPSCYHWGLLAVSVPLWILVAWSRAYRRRHSAAEVVWGSIAGLAAAAVFFLTSGGAPMG